jgi:hypothetical protein
MYWLQAYPIHSLQKFCVTTKLFSGISCIFWGIHSIASYSRRKSSTTPISSNRTRSLLWRHWSQIEWFTLYSVSKVFREKSYLNRMSTYKDYLNKLWYDPKNPVGFTGLKALRRLSFHISACLSSIFSISFHISTYFSSTFSISFHYSTYLSSIF